MPQERIGDAAILGDGRSAALVSRSGSVHWLCWPRFDSDPLFAALLDPERGGFFRLAPRGPARTTRRYVGDTNVLQTRFETGEGVLVVTDFMPVAAEDESRRGLRPEHALVRIARCERGVVDVEATFAPRPSFGAARFRLEDRGALGLRISRRQGLTTLRSDPKLRLAEDGTASRAFALRAGETARFVLTHAARWPEVLPPLDEHLDLELQRTLRYWESWIARMRYDGPDRDAVARSALALKLLQYAPSGAIVAAPTTSLPERIGGDLNWDYRYCWLRDAAFTARALFGLGFSDEAHAFVSWLLHATRATAPDLRVFYDVFGRTTGGERDLPHLRGYLGSRPVRVGNGAVDQLQLDAYGEVVEAVLEVTERGGDLDRETARMLVRLGEAVCRRWEEPDQGIWEVRGDPMHFTHSKLMCWATLDCLLALEDRGRLGRIPRERFEQNRAWAAQAIAERGYDRRLGSFTQTLDGDVLDASLLLLPLYGFCDASDERMKSTLRAVRARLGTPRGLLYRYEQSIGREGAFLMCGFWLAEVLARGGGTLDEARACFEASRSVANDVGLLSEEADPETGELLGNFPQGFSHIGLINAALALARRERQEAASRATAPVSQEVAP